MPRKSVPSYRLHKASGQARAIVNGKHIYLGKFNSPESRKNYALLLANLELATSVDESTRSGTNTDRDLHPPLRIEQQLLLWCYRLGLGSG